MPTSKHISRYQSVYLLGLTQTAPAALRRLAVQARTACGGAPCRNNLRKSYLYQRRHRQLGLSLLWVAVGSALLAVLAIGTLYSIRYERNVFVDATEKLLGKPDEMANKSKQAMNQAKAAVTGQAPAKNFDGTMYKCQVNGQTTYSNLPCAGQGKELKLKDNSYEAPKPPPVEETPPMNATDRAIEKATR